MDAHLSRRSNDRPARLRGSASILALLGLLACGDDGGATADASSDSGTGSPPPTGADTSASDTEPSSPDDSTGPGEPPPASADWCARVVPGPSATDEALLALSRAHAGIRFFGAAPSYEAADSALTAAMAHPEASGPADLEAYAQALDSVCALPSEPSPLLDAEVRLEGEVAWVRPGLGEIEIPEAAALVALDLRDLPAVPELDAALERAAAAALSEDLPMPAGRVRAHFGHTDQRVPNQYETDVVVSPSHTIEAAGTNPRRVVVVTAQRLAPAAARLAGSLRVQRRAHLVGYDVPAEVAESRWTAVADTGLAWRDRELLQDGEARWPDSIPPDVATDDPERAIVSASDYAELPAPLEGGRDERSSIVPYEPLAEQVSPELGPGQARSMLVIAHGALRLFFPYFELVGDDIDPALLELVSEIDDGDPTDRAQVERRLDRLVHTLHDGHGVTLDLEDPATPLGYLSAMFEYGEGLPIVRRTNHPGLAAGDTFVRIDGVPTIDWYDEQRRYVSAASEGFALDQVTYSMLTTMQGPLDVVIQGADGTERAQTLEPGPREALTDLELDVRRSGWLGDLGAPSIYYVTMEWMIVESDDTQEQLDAIDEAIEGGATGIVVDMRGYPRSDLAAVAQRLIPGEFSSPLFLVPTYEGLDAFTLFDVSDTIPESSAYDGPIALLVGPRSISAAETFATMLVGAERVTVVGQPSAATNGNITSIRLPGGFMMIFTGLDARFPDGSTFHGVGIQPDVVVEPDPLDYAAGLDPEVLAAIDVIDGAM